MNLIDQYGQDKVLAEAAIRASGLPYALFRLGGIISPDTHASINGDYLLLMRSMPSDNRMHAVDARDVALAFANGVDRAATISGKVLLIGGNESYVLTQRELEDAMMEAVGLGRLGPSASCPATRPTTGAGVSPAGTTPPKPSSCSTSRSTTGARRWPGWPNRRAAAGSPCDCWGRYCGPSCAPS